MRISIDVRGLAEFKRELSRLAGTEKDRAIAAAINKTVDKGQAEINRAVSETYAISRSDVKASLELRRASAKRGNVLEAAITIFGSKSKRGRSMNMIHFLAAFNAMPTRTYKDRGKKAAIKALTEQLGFQIKRGGGLKQIPGAFVGNKGRTVFRRTGNRRLPIEPVQVIGVAQMFNSKTINQRVMAKIEAEFGVELRRAVESVIARRRA